MSKHWMGREGEGILGEGNIMSKLIKARAQKNSEGIYIDKCPEVKGRNKVIDKIQADGSI